MLGPLEVIRAYPPHGATLHGLLASRAATDPARPFLLFEHEAISYAQFSERVLSTARGLAASGIAPGDRVGVMATNSARYVVLFFALARLGAVMVPVNPEFGVREAGYILQHSGVRALATIASALGVAREATRPIVPAPWIFLLEEDLDEIARQRGVLPPAPPAEATCLVLYTSGTTGFPKGVMHRQRSFVLAGEGFVARVWLQPEDRLLCILPLFHINALFYSLAGALAAGASLTLAPKFSAAAFWSSAAESGATQVNIIAAIGNILARRPRSEFDPRHRLRVVYGAPISPELERVLREEFHVPVVIEGYGMTEIPGAANNPFDGERRANSMGKAALHPDPAVKFAELRIVDDEGRDVPDGALGEIWVKTPILMQGYYRDPGQTAASIADGWFKTGDLARRDADGYYYFIARKNDIIRRRGENISGAEIDRIVGDHPAVLLCAAIAVPAELGEDEILVAVVKKPETEVSAQEIAAWCRERLAAIKVPRYVAFADSLPVTATQRVQKFQLRGDASLRARAIDLGP
ncbi:MAG: long-chain fatty acid--CoA ligase [Betaproteobacteria bacterium RIFCSPLOWO2_02_FULL_68_150]|nr:MAG: long-chain fatty acid--CoA ligase [Betaproteobacteria bacterium RIFCSPLOWO2_02_FULL_68_150]